MAAWRYEISLLALKNISLIRCASSWKIYSTLEEKFRISVGPCNILYIFNECGIECTITAEWTLEDIKLVDVKEAVPLTIVLEVSDRNELQQNVESQECAPHALTKLRICWYILVLLFNSVYSFFQRKNDKCYLHAEILKSDVRVSTSPLKT